MKIKKTIYIFTLPHLYLQDEECRPNITIADFDYREIEGNKSGWMLLEKRELEIDYPERDQVEQCERDRLSGEIEREEARSRVKVKSLRDSLSEINASAFYRGEL